MKGVRWSDEEGNGRKIVSKILFKVSHETSLLDLQIFQGKRS